MVSHSKQGGKNMHNRFILFKNDDVGRQSSRGFKSRNVTVFYGSGKDLLGTNRSNLINIKMPQCNNICYIVECYKIIKYDYIQ